MTKKLLALLATLSLLLMPLHGYADKDNKGPGDQAYKSANDNAAFKADQKDKDKKKNKKKEKKNKNKNKNKNKDGVKSKDKNKDMNRDKEKE